MNEELRTFSDLDRLRAEAAEKRQLLESEHLSLGTRKTASIQDANSVQANLDLVIFSHYFIGAVYKPCGQMGVVGAQYLVKVYTFPKKYPRYSFSVFMYT